ncbi:MAG: hypothetical protein WCC92_15315 [Candidatus Korobacteraceae bacterium]
MNILQLTTQTAPSEAQVTNPAVQRIYQKMEADVIPEFYLDDMKGLRQHKIQPYFRRQAAKARPQSLRLMEHVRYFPSRSVPSIESLWGRRPRLLSSASLSEFISA